MRGGIIEWVSPLANMEENFQQIKQELVEEYEKRNTKLVECLRSLEGIYDKQKQDFSEKQFCLEAENQELKKKLETTLVMNSELDSRRVKFNPEPSVSRLNLPETSESLVEELEAKVRSLNYELKKRDELAAVRRKRDEVAKSKSEAEVKALRKKATVGWMFGCLWEESLPGAEQAEAIPVLKTLRKLQKDLEQESWSVAGSSTDSWDRDVQALLDKIKLQQEESLQASGPASSSGDLMKVAVDRSLHTQTNNR